MKNRMIQLYVKAQMFGRAVLRNAKGQDLIEYALLAGFVAVAGAALMPDIGTSISQILSSVQSTLSRGATCASGKGC